MRTRAPERTSLRSVWKAGWRLASLSAAGGLALAVYVGLTVGANTYAALIAAIGIGPLLILPITRRIVWLVLASVAGIAFTAALAMVT